MKRNQVLVGNNVFKIEKKNAIQWLMVVGVFLPVNFMMVLFPMVLEICSLLIAVFLLRSMNRKLLLNRNLLFSVSILLIFYFVVIYFNGYSYNKFIRECFLFLIFSSIYYILFNFVKLDLASLFNKYLILAYWISMLAIIQFVVYFVFNVNVFSLFSRQTSEIMPRLIRVTSVEVEPSVLSTLLTPSFVYCFFYIKQYKKMLCVITLAIFFTFSTVSYLVCLGAFVYIVAKKNNFSFKYIALLFIFSIFLYGNFYVNDSAENSNGAFKEISTKIGQTYDGVKDLDPHAIEMLNLSSYATLMNLYVAIKAPSRIVGTGVGTHSQSYERIYQSDYENYGLNKHDAYSLVTRIYSELGLIGLILMLMFVFYNFNSSNIINTSVFFILITFFLRGGHYFINGTFFFFFLYYYTKKISYENNSCIGC